MNLTNGFKNFSFITDSLQDFSQSSGSLVDSHLPQQFCDASSQTDIIGEVCLLKGQETSVLREKGFFYVAISSFV